MASPLSKLPDDLNRELFLLLPTAEDPTCLLRVSLTNKKCHRILAHPDRLPKSPPGEAPPDATGLGVDHQREGRLDGLVPLRRQRPRLQPPRGCACSTPATAASVLFLAPSPSPARYLIRYNLVVWIPLTNEYSCLPQPEPPLTGVSTMLTNYINAAVLCSAAAGDTCDHRNCHGGHFRVALVQLTGPGGVMSVRVYSSVTGDWSAPCSAQCPVGFGYIHPSTLVGDTLYFRCELGYVLAYQLGVQPQLSFFTGPPNSAAYPWGVSLMPMDGGLGCMCIEDDESGLCLRKWSREAAADGVAKWTKGTAIEIKKLLPHAALQSMQLASASSPRKLQFLGSAEGTGVIFLGTSTCGHPNVVYMVDVNSREARAEKVFDVSNVVVPYISSHIPVPATAPN